jgi:hypothetical protein
MPVKLSAYLCLRNNYLMPIVKSDLSNDTARDMKPGEKARLKKLIDEIDELHKGSEVGHNTEGIVGPNVILPGGYSEIIERSFDPRKSGQLFHEIHRVLRDHYVAIDIYRCLGRAFSELGIEDVDPELQIAINYGTENFNRRGIGLYANISQEMCPRVVIESALKRQGRSKEQF